MANLFQLTVAAAVCCLAIAAPRDLSVSWNIQSQEGKPVNVTLYYESLCGGCHEFITNSLVPTWNKVKDTGLMTVNLLPYGNARESFEGGEWKFDCQHGVKECEGNVLETCIVHYYNDTTKQLEIIKCVEEDFYKTQGADWEKTLQTCSSTGVDIEKVTKCAKGKEGNTLQHQVAVLTGKHEYVPYLFLDGKVDKAGLENFLEEVCKAYKGTPPSVCN